MIKFILFASLLLSFTANATITAGQSGSYYTYSIGQGFSGSPSLVVTYSFYQQTAQQIINMRDSITGDTLNVALHGAAFDSSGPLERAFERLKTGDKLRQVHIFCRTRVVSPYFTGTFLQISTGVNMGNYVQTATSPSYMNCAITNVSF